MTSVPLSTVLQRTLQPSDVSVCDADFPILARQIRPPIHDPADDIIFARGALLVSTGEHASGSAHAHLPRLVGPGRIDALVKIREAD